MTNVVPRLSQARSDLASMQQTLETANWNVASAARALETAPVSSVPGAPLPATAQGALALVRAQLGSVSSELGRTHLAASSDAVAAATQGVSLLQAALDRATTSRHPDLPGLATDLHAIAARLGDASVTAATDNGTIGEALRVVTGAGHPVPEKLSIGELRSMAKGYLPLAEGTRSVITTVTAMDDIVATMAPRTATGPGPFQPLSEFERRGVLALGNEAQSALSDTVRVAAHLPDGSQVGEVLEGADARISGAFRYGHAPGTVQPLLDAAAVRDTLDAANGLLEQGVQQSVAEREALLTAATYASTRVDAAR